MQPMYSYSQGPSSDVGAVFVFVMMAFAILTALAITILMIVAWWKICTKAGFSGWLALLMLVPIANIVLPLIVAFMDWPVHQQLRACKDIIDSRQGQSEGV